MRFERSAGILLHPTSLPGKFGIGDFGYEAFNFVNFLESCGQTLWQVFPLGPTGYGDSPYQCFSAFAGNPNLISPEKLRDAGFLTDEDINNVPHHNPSHIDYGTVINYKRSILQKAFSSYRGNDRGIQKDFDKFSKDNAYWLDDFALFMAAKEHHNGVAWPDWDKDLVIRKKEALDKWNEKLSEQVLYQKFVQYIFSKQWHDVKAYANSKRIKIIGDMPIFVAYDSSDVWANNKIFTLDEKGKLQYVAGVPPDYFSETGQLWGNPLFIWEEMEKDDFAWWRSRLSKLLDFVDIIRIDHFRGFDAFWRIPGDAPTAVTGKWIKAPGEKFFSTVREYLGEPPIIAEDLGLITKSVTALREKFNFPGMKILQFAFGTDMETKFLPHNITPDSAVYTGSHDNDTTRAYFEKAKGQDNDIYAHAQKYLNYYGDDMVGELIRTAYATVADLVVIPMQDVLNLGGEARMNFPGKLGGNWTWRFTWDQVNHNLPSRFKEMAELYERPPKPKKDVELEDNEEGAVQTAESKGK